jgi:hypothetical protein
MTEILSSPTSSILASLERDPAPLVRLHWCRRVGGEFRSGHGDQLVPLGVGRRAAAKIVEAARCDAWLVVEGRVG